MLLRSWLTNGVMLTTFRYWGVCKKGSNKGCHTLLNRRKNHVISENKCIIMITKSWFQIVIIASLWTNPKYRLSRSLKLRSDAWTHLQMKSKLIISLNSFIYLTASRLFIRSFLIGLNIIGAAVLFRIASSVIAGFVVQPWTKDAHCGKLTF